MARILRGDVVWADLGTTVGSEQRGPRPVVILSNDTFNENSDTVIAVAVTSQRPAAQFPLTVEIRSVNLPKRSWAKMGQVRTLSSARLGKVLGRLSSEELKRIIQGLGEILGAGPNA